ncbi:unnamed protein product [Dibothriocephalus latus]|uniref:Uncharacterized protein n=1 Tax=Dibothriocephalus latus TaxID=60516 RepID=A0A3P7P5B8_DIBLA|nr:unnamed protein product [Dibothriocephalus latus]
MPEQLSLSTDMAIVVRAMLAPDSGLEIHDRTWLKITIPNAVIVRLKLPRSSHFSNYGTHDLYLTIFPPICGN